MAPPREGTVVIEDARLLFRNLEGRETMYNSKGDRNFCVVLDEDVARQMAADGWNIKVLKPREADESGEPYIQVSVGYKIRPPKIMMLTSRGKTPIGEAEVELLDWVDIKTVDLIIRPYSWNVGGRGGIKAYLQTMYITIEEDYLDMKYADVPTALPSRPDQQELERYSGDTIEGEWHDA